MTESVSESERKSESVPVPVVCLAPMVRAGSLPFRTLCLKYGADLVWGEEVIDKRIMKCSRVVNDRLGTIDFVAEEGRVLVFRTTNFERNRVVFQMGTASAEVALAAARVIENDVVALDINMGCPKKFSIQGGMGASLLSHPETACDIIRTLSSNLSIPVYAKIRVLDSVEATISFMQKLQEAGASVITVHLRTKSTPSNAPAAWDLLPALVRGVSIPVYANGDVYTMADAEYLIRHTGCSGVMMGRPVLLNPSLLTRPFPLTPPTTEVDATAEVKNCFVPVTEEQKACWKNLKDVICDFLEECVNYDPPFPIVKYTIQEMMSQRRHCQERLKFLRQSGLPFGRMNSIYQTLSAARSLPEMCEVFDLPELANRARQMTPVHTNTSKKRPRSGSFAEDSVVDNSVSELQPDHRFDSSYFDQEKECES